jgi:hypothetical protein
MCVLSRVRRQTRGKNNVVYASFREDRSPASGIRQFVFDVYLVNFSSNDGQLMGHPKLWVAKLGYLVVPWARLYPAGSLNWD